MESPLFFTWMLLLVATLAYLGLLYGKKQYRHRDGLVRLLFLVSLLVLLRPLPEGSSTQQKHLFVLLDLSKSMQSHFVEATEVSHLKELLSPQMNEVLEAQYPHHQKHYYDLHQPQKLPQTPGEPFAPKWHLDSPILKNLLHFIKTAAPPESSRLVLISDGQDTEFEEFPAAFQEQQPLQKLALDILAMPPSSPEPDLAIEQVNNPRVAFKKSPVSLRVTLRSHLKSPQTSQLILTDGQAILDKEMVEFPAGEHQHKTELSWTPLEAEHSLLFLRLLPLEEEKNLHNNVSYLPLTVRSHRHRVLHIAGRPSWDVLHLRSLLKSMPALDLIAFYILRDPYRDIQNVADHEMALIQFPVKELFQVELFKFDTVIFHNFAIQSYLHNPAFQQSFQKYLRQGKKIIVIGGEQALGQPKYQQLFLKPGTDLFRFELRDFASASPQTSLQLSAPYLRRQPSFAGIGLSENLPTPDRVTRTHFDRGHVDWIADPFLWKNQPSPDTEPLGQAGDFAAFWQTLLYQPEYETLNVFQDFQRKRPYTTHQSIEGKLVLPSQRTDLRQNLRLEVIDQTLNLVVWETPISTKEPASVQLPLLSPSWYELRLTCDCAEMPDIVQKFTVVEDWLELRTTSPNLPWLEQLAAAMGGELFELSQSH